jgi:hypothetical protein
MRRKQKRRKTRGKRRTTPHSSFLSKGLEYKEIRSPFDGLSQAEVLERVKSTGEEFAGVFSDTFDDLQKQILAAEPLVLLSSLSYQMLIIQAHRRRSSIEKLPIQQHDLELLQDRRAVGVKFLPEGVEEYCERHTTALTDLHERLLKETEEKTTTANFLVGEIEGAFLKMLVRMTQATRILEVGSLPATARYRSPRRCLRMV